MAQTGLSLSDIETIIRTRRRTEALKRQFLCRYAECEAVLDAFVARKENLPRALRLRAELAARRRQWNEAIDLWQRFIAEVDADDTDAIVKLAAALRKAGRLAESKQALGQARKRGLGGKVFRRARKRIRNSERMQRQADLGRRAASVMLGDTDEDVVAIYRELLRRRRLPEGGDEHLLPLLEDLARFALRAGIKASPEWRDVRWMSRALRGMFTFGPQDGGLRSRAPIFSCGFGFSGSGAVTDFLRDHGECDTAFGAGELLWFHGDWQREVTGAVHLLDYTDQGPARYGWHVVNFFLVCVLGLQGLAAADESYHGGGVARRPRPSMLRCCLAHKADLARFIEYARDLLQGFSNTRGGSGAESLLGTFFARYFGLFGAPDRRAVLSNCIKADKLLLLRLVPRAQAVVARRDPRDQFVARAHESMGGPWPVERFVSWFRERETRYRVARFHPRLRGRVRAVQFERFVLEPPVRDALSQWLGLEHTAGDTGRFRPEESRQNIGIHKDWPERRDIEHIEKELRRYLAEEAD